MSPPEASWRPWGFDVSLDRKSLRGGDVWDKQIESEIDDRDVTLAALSTGSYESEICRAEQGWPLDKRKCVIPARAPTDRHIPLRCVRAAARPPMSNTSSLATSAAAYAFSCSRNPEPHAHLPELRTRRTHTPRATPEIGPRKPRPPR